MPGGSVFSRRILRTDHIPDDFWHVEQIAGVTGVQGRRAAEVERVVAEIKEVGGIAAGAVGDVSLAGKAEQVAQVPLAIDILVIAKGPCPTIGPGPDRLMGGFRPMESGCLLVPSGRER